MSRKITTKMKRIGEIEFVNTLAILLYVKDNLKNSKKQVIEGLDLPYVKGESPNEKGVDYETAMKTAEVLGLEINGKCNRFYAPELIKYNFKKSE